MPRTRILTDESRRPITAKTWTLQKKCRRLKKQTKQIEGAQNNFRNKNTGANKSIPNNNSNNKNNSKSNNRAEKSQKLITHPVRNVKNTQLHREMLFWGQCNHWTASPERETGRTEPGPTKRQPKQFKWRCSSSSPKFKLQTPHP